MKTQFYGGKQVMKKRFKNILLKTGKKNGAYILICAVILAVSLGALIGCSINESSDVPDIVWEKAEELVAGWYAFDSTNHEEYYFTDWRIESLTHCYTYEDFDGMVLQVYRLNHEFLSDKPENIILAGGTSITEDGWVAFNPNSGYLVYEQDGEELSFLVFMSENDCFPGDEVFSNDLKYQLENIGTNVDTFALSQDRVPEVVIESEDIQEIKNIIEEFSASYFSGDADALQKFLASPYEWDIDVYEGTGTAGDFTIKGLPDVGEWNAGNTWEIWLEFMDSNDDSYTYLTFSFIRQEGNWKIQFYGLEK